ncbi:pentapeptide repeat-containing protein [Streptosporangiaceae bacterium NEAU-GS5]|nr:pentapeptide repeat-containing protein [Streptosporangiaceae bacterium NEAU-GS5]
MTSTEVEMRESEAELNRICSHKDSYGRCLGVRATTSDRCLAHLDPRSLEAALSELHPGSSIDLSGVRIDAELLTAIKAACQDANGHAIFGAAKFMQAHFTEDAIFEEVLFRGAVTFIRATFSGSALFILSEFEGDVQFDDAEVRGSLEVYNSVFEQRASFARARISKDCSFELTKFHGPVSLAGLNCEDGGRSSRVEFAEQVTFAGATYGQDCRFLETSFHKRADFMNMSFRGVAYFDHARFDDEAHFMGAQFGELASFSHTKFCKDAVFYNALFKREVVCNDMRVEGKVSFAGSRFERASQIGPMFTEGLEFDESSFDSPIQIEATCAYVRGIRAHFESRATLRFHGASSVILDGATFGGPTSISGGPHSVLASLRDLDASTLVLANVDLTRCQFAGSFNLDKLRLDSGIRFPVPPGGFHRGLVLPFVWRWSRRQMLAEECAWRSCQKKSSGWTTPKFVHRDADQLEPDQIIELYRALRKAREDAKDEPGAADFYYGEMEMRRKAKSTPLSEQFILWLYWVTSGYGLRSSRALAIFAIVVALASMALASVGFAAGGHSYLAAPQSWRDCLLYALSSTLSLEVKLASLPDNLTTWGQGIRLALRLFGPLLLGLAFLAIRGRVRR